jgi:class 3 adenylate cyclase
VASAKSSDLLARTSEVRYARADGDVHLAYRVITGRGEPMHDVVLMSSGTASMEALFEDPIGVRLLDGLADLGRLVVFDRSGIGISDPPADWANPPLTRWLGDLETIVEAAEVARPMLMATRISALVALAHAEARPADVSSVVMLEPSDPRLLDPAMVRLQLEGKADSLAYFCPSRADEPGFRAWFDRAGQQGASPRLAARAYPQWTDGEIREIEATVSRVDVPTLVLRRPAHIASPEPAHDWAMAHVPGAVRVDLPGEDLLLFGGEVDALLAEVSRFVTGEHRLPAPERVLAAILFSDLVASTERASELGDAHWKRLLDRHDTVARACIGRRGGTIVKIDGDGILATLPSVTNAVRAGQELRSALARDGLDVRAGIHVGDIDRRGDDISGIAVNIAARVMAHAGAGELLVSEVVPALVSGSGMQFEDRGEHTLKGVPGMWRLFEVIP